MTSSSISPTSATAAPTFGLPDIAFTGRAGAGKTTAADALVELGYRHLSFADTMKNMAQTLWGPGADTDRSKLQPLGMAVREIEPDTWVRLLVHQLSQIRQIEPTRVPLVVDDLRFPNEWHALKAEGFKIVRVQAPLAIRVDRLKRNGKYQNDEQLDHETETAVADYSADFAIDNWTDDRDALWDRLVEILLKARKR